jgi:hypothetical protein
MYQSQQRSTDICIDFYLHSTQDSSCGRNCLRFKIVDLRTGGAIKSVPCVALGYTNPYALPSVYVHLYTLPIHTYFIIHCLSGRCRIRYHIFPTKTPEVYCTVGS